MLALQSRSLYTAILQRIHTRRRSSLDDIPQPKHQSHLPRIHQTNRLINRNASRTKHSSTIKPSSQLVHSVHRPPPSVNGASSANTPQSARTVQPHPCPFSKDLIEIDSSNTKPHSLLPSASSIPISLYLARISHPTDRGSILQGNGMSHPRHRSHSVTTKPRQSVHP